MKTNHYKQQSIKFLGFITSVCFALFLSSCGTENDESFEMPSEEVLERVAAATKVAGKYFSECNSITELKQHLDEIRSTEGVIDVWTDEQSMYMEIEDWGVIYYYYPIVPDNEVISATRSFDGETFLKTNACNMLSSSTRADIILSDNIHHRLNDQVNHSFVIYNATFTDHRYNYANYIAKELQVLYNDLGIKTNLIQNPSKSCVDFFSKEISKYDLVFFMGHGGYDEKYDRHLLLTGERVKIGDSLTVEEMNDYKTQHNYWKYFSSKTISKEVYLKKKIIIINENEKNTMMFFGCQKEEDANGNKKPTWYVGIYENFLSANMPSFANKSIVFSSACSSMKSTPSMGDIFCQKGAACYLGYDNTNCRGRLAGNDFFKGLLNCWSAQSSYNKLDKHYRFDDFPTDKPCNSNLILHTKDNNEEEKHVCITHPITDEKYLDYYDYINLKGSIKIADPNNNNEYGFALRDKNSKKYKIIKGIKYNDKASSTGYFSYNYGSHTLSFECNVGKALFKDVDQFCAYLYDGERYCLGDPKDIDEILPVLISCPDENHPHAIDLGLPSGTKWACCNIGVTYPNDEDREDRYDYPWGYTRPITTEHYYYYSGYAFSGYVWSEEYEKGKYRWCCDKSYDYLGDDISNTEYDAPHMDLQWGKEGWSMPTLDDVKELFENCIRDDIKKYYIGRNGYYIYFPASKYWTSTLGPKTAKFPEPYMCAYSFYPFGDEVIYLDLRNYPYHIRPVLKQK